MLAVNTRSPCSGRTRRVNVGFTMIELLIVVTIIGVFAGAVAYTFGPNSKDRAIQTEARRMHAALSLAAEEAIFLGDELGVELFADGYRFVRWEESDQFFEEQALDDADASEEGNSSEGVELDSDEVEAVQSQEQGKWVAIQADRLLKTYQLPEAMRFFVRVEDVEIDLIEMEEADQADDISQLDDLSDALSDAKEPEIEPAILLLSSGESTSYYIELYYEGENENAYKLRGDIIGQVTMEEPHAEEF